MKSLPRRYNSNTTSVDNANGTLVVRLPCIIRTGGMMQCVYIRRKKHSTDPFDSVLAVANPVAIIRVMQL